jgi:hypothetical protein
VQPKGSRASHRSRRRSFNRYERRSSDPAYVAVAPLDLHRFSMSRCSATNTRTGTDGGRFLAIATNTIGHRLIYKALIAAGIIKQPDVSTTKASTGGGAAHRGRGGRGLRVFRTNSKGSSASQKRSLTSTLQQSAQCAVTSNNAVQASSGPLPERNLAFIGPHYLLLHPQRFPLRAILRLP